MTEAINRFYNSIEDVEKESQTALIELFVYFLTVELGGDVAHSKKVIECFNDCDLTPPSNVGTRLSEGLKSKPQKYIRVNGAYKLHRHRREALSRKLGAETTIVQTSATLRNLEHKLSDGPSKDFLKETIDCFEVKANRGTIIMAWILTMDHLFTYILKHKLIEFNVVLGNNKDKRIKIKTITQRDDFSDIPEGKFIDFCRSANIITNDVRKILEQKLGIRNSSAHPSGISINNTKVIDFVEDLVENIILKYSI